MEYINNTYLTKNKTQYTNTYFLSLYNILNISDFYNWFDNNKNALLLTRTRIFETCLIKFYVKNNNKIILSESMNNFVNEKITEVTIMLFPYFNAKNSKFKNFTNYETFVNNIKFNNTKIVNLYINYLHNTQNKLNNKLFRYYLMIYLEKKLIKNIN